FTLTADPAEADVLLVNTCGFITPAKEESINTILEMAAYKTAGHCRILVGTGCLTERYARELKEEMPELDLIWGIKDHKGLVRRICQLAGVIPEKGCCPRVLTTPSYSAYLRIADGCDNRCTYCAIPLIRGPRVSVPMEDLLAEAQRLAAEGVVELTVIAQDTSAYGSDLYGKPMLRELLLALCKIEDLHWIRVLYTYPNTVDEALMEAMLAEPKLVPYLDMPIQHIAPHVLRRMNRHGSAEHIRHMVDYIRERSHDFILRTTVITGFPGETEEEFGQLAEFLQAHPFDRLGAFAYSIEENTPAAEMTDQIEESVKQGRLDRVMQAQRAISLSRNQARIGRVYEVLVEGIEDTMAYGRSYAEAPEVDGSIRFQYGEHPPQPGSFVQVRITKAGPYDLWGEQI
ncbi:MAG: 30S ribosomal protein S12 methylthiotransferase RimO, partial [Clostridia bacterium]|nr:30S ribosomal protein S12 methylthiotransferase RimO [Clostridia bacterium]